VSVCGLYVRYIVKLRYPLCARALLCRAVGMSHVVSGRGLQLQATATGGLVNATPTHLYFLYFISNFK